MAAYVKSIEAAGARVVPLIMGENPDQIKDKMAKLNGVLFPGGSGNYIEFGRPIYEEILRQNDNGQYFPAMGTCLGMEALVKWAADGGASAVGDFDAHNVSLKLQYTVDPADTEMFGSMGQSAYLFEGIAMTLNSHSHSIDPSTFESDEGLKNMFRMTSISYEPDGEHRPFAASMESERYPIMATQFHPEKTTAAFNDDKGVNHSWTSIEMNRKFADHFVSLARRSTKSFGNFAET